MALLPMDRPLSIVTASTLFPNSARPSHGVFVKTRLKKLLETGRVVSQVIAPVGWVPPGIAYAGTEHLRQVPYHETIDGIPVHHPRYLIVPKVGMTITPYFLYRALKKAVGALLASGRTIDLIDAHYFYPDGVAAQWVARDFGLPVVITARGTDLNLIPQYPAPRRMIVRAAEAADGLITVCEALKTSLVELGIAPERVTVLRNGVDLELFRPQDRAAARSEFALRRRTLVSVGHLIRRKGHHHVIGALPHLADTDLIIAGDGEEKSALQALARRLGVEDRVRFLGAVSQERLRALYNAADALVLASSREGWANVLLEAMACGTPVVASNVWGTPEVVAAPEAGRLMDSLDAAGVARAVAALFENLPERAATRAYAEKFGWQPTTEGQLTLFRHILERRAAQSNSAS
jgi:glycosyltransferase involved in cell wall biosynthesis